VELPLNRANSSESTVGQLLPLTDPDVAKGGPPSGKVKVKSGGARHIAPTRYPKHFFRSREGEEQEGVDVAPTQYPSIFFSSEGGRRAWVGQRG
jgi:hypothetical protein